MPNLRLSDKLMYSTFKIICTLENKKTCSGTGFILRKDNSLAIVTNKHVIENSITGEFTMTEGDEYNDPILGRGIKIRFDKFSEMWTRHPNPEIDLAVMPLKLAVEECRRQGATPFYTTIQLNTIPNDNEWKEFIPIEDILMIGYPNGLWDDINNLPFFRRGITATHPGINYKGKDEFVIHTAIYPGSSGSPIFRLTEDFYKRSRNFQGGDDAVKLLGIAYKHLLYTAEAKIISETVAQKINVSSRILLDLGVVIRSNKLTDFQSILTQNRLEWEL